MALFFNILTFLNIGLAVTSGLITYQAIQSVFNPPFQLTPIIQTYEGPVQGKIAYSRNGSEYWQFLGIPYAQSPIRSLRFQAPIPVKRWYDVKQVTQFQSLCLQFESMMLVHKIGQEDCLFLNVFVNPAGRVNGKKVPVIVYFHGGGFSVGQSNLYHPEYLMDQPIIVVTFNYRLSFFGFANFEEKDDPKQRYPRGNMGLKDQNLVLQWVRRNIGVFSGDPDRVTLIGHSAGAASINFHMLSPLSRKLFQRVVLFSGSALCPWAFSNNARNVAVKFARRVGCPANNVTEMFDCLMAYDGDKLVEHFPYAWTDPLHENDLFLPSVEPIVTEDTFLSESPKEVLRSGKVSRVPTIFCLTSGEGGIRSARFEASPEMILKLDENWNQLIGRVLFHDEPLLKPRIAGELRRVYFGGTKLGSTFTAGDVSDFLQNLTKLAGDVLFHEPIHNAALEHSRVAPTHMMYFDYRSVMLPGLYSYYRSVRPEDRHGAKVKLFQGLFTDWFKEQFLGHPGAHKYGVSHGEDVYQLWNYNGLSKWLSDGDVEFSEAYVKAIVDFSKGVTPLSFRGITWPAVTTGVSRSSPSMMVPFLEINKVGGARLTEEPFTNRVQMINELLAKP